MLTFHVISLVPYLAQYHQPCDNNAFAIIKAGWSAYTAKHPTYTVHEKADTVCALAQSLTPEQVRACFIRCKLPPYALVHLITTIA